MTHSAAEEGRESDRVLLVGAIAEYEVPKADMQTKGDDRQVITSEIDEGIDERTYQVVPGARAFEFPTTTQDDCTCMFVYSGVPVLMIVTYTVLMCVQIVLAQSEFCHSVQLGLAESELWHSVPRIVSPLFKYAGFLAACQQLRQNCERMLGMAYQKGGGCRRCGRVWGQVFLRLSANKGPWVATLCLLCFGCGTFSRAPTRAVPFLGSGLYLLTHAACSGLAPVGALPVNIIERSEPV